MSWPLPMCLLFWLGFVETVANDLMSQDDFVFVQGGHLSPKHVYRGHLSPTPPPYDYYQMHDNEYPTPSSSLRELDNQGTVFVLLVCFWRSPTAGCRVRSFVRRKELLLRTIGSDRIMQRSRQGTQEAVT